jgi:YegS/Rv2252/BmrU family lipid kinase
MKKYLFIVNPVAGNGNGKKVLPIIRNELTKRKLHHKIVLTEEPKHATAIVKEYKNEFNHFVSVGGDGTLNEVINGLDYETAPILGVLPVGSGNDFSHNIGLNKNFNYNLNLNTNAHHQIIKTDIGIVEYKSAGSEEIYEKKFVNSLGIGFDAYVAYLNQNHKVLSGISSYLVAVIKALMKLQNLEVEAQIDDKEISGEKLLISIGNGKTTGGGFYLTPKADVSDNKFDLCVIEKINRLKLIRKLPLAMVNKLDKVREVSMLTFNKAEILLKTPYYVHVDGEIISDAVEHLKVSILKQQLDIIGTKNVFQKTET